jgi:hypothetical protein
MLVAAAEVVLLTRSRKFWAPGRAPGRDPTQIVVSFAAYGVAGLPLGIACGR